MYTFSLCHDAALIKDTVLQPHNIPFQFDDSHSPSDYEVIFDPKILYIKVERNHRYQGLFLIIYKDYSLAEAHLAVMPCAFGRVAEMGKECLNWVWANTYINHLICPVLADNGLALNCVKKMGFHPYSRQKDKWVRDGTSHDYIWLKIDRTTDAL